MVNVATGFPQTSGVGRAQLLGDHLQGPSLEQNQDAKDHPVEAIRLRGTWPTASHPWADRYSFLISFLERWNWSAVCVSAVYYVSPVYIAF